MDSIPPPSSDDLFDGDILGDELMDIYNAAVVGGGSEADLNEIPSLLGSSDLPTDGGKKDQTVDDGFGAFRPSTSFNNLSVTFEEATNHSASAGVAPTVQPSSDTSINATRVVSSTSLTPDLATAQTVALAPIVTTPGGTKRKLEATAPSETSPKRKNSIGSKSTKSLTNKKPVKKKIAPNLPSISVKAIHSTSASNIPSANTQLVTPITPNNLAPAQTLSTVAVKQELQAPVSAASHAHSVSSVTAKKKSAQVSKSASTKANAPTTSVLSNPPTEADFKSVAQAAVNNLIMNAGSANKANNSKSTKGRSDSLPASGANSKTSSVTTTKRIDTSTEHVKALTGSNWVAVCGGANTSGESNINQSNTEKICNRARRTNLTPDERARQNRDRNREHARNTRLRKKAYVEELKATLSALVSQRDAAELEKRHASQREMEQREVRFRVLEEFLKLRGRNETNVARWAAILDENFTLNMPVTKFRAMVHSNDSNHRNANAVHEQILTGLVEVMDDSTLCSSFLQSLGKRGNNEIITLAFNCERHNFFMDNCTAMLDWTATTHGASEQGIELIVKGHTRAKFCPASNKLISVVISFDTGAIVSQVNLIKKVKESSEAEAAAAAAQVAASEADALLDSLQMPHFDPPSATPVSNKMNVVSVCSGSSSSGSISEEKAVISSDDENHNNIKDEASDDQMAF